MAANIKVDCKRGGKIQKALDQLSPLSPSVVTVSGRCNENILIQGFNRLTLQGISGATINDASSGTGFVVDIEDSTDILLEGFTINGGFISVLCGNFSAFCPVLTVDTIQGEPLDLDFQAIQSRATFDNNIIKNNAARGWSRANRVLFVALVGSLFKAMGLPAFRTSTVSSLDAWGTTIKNNGAHEVPKHTTTPV